MSEIIGWIEKLQGLGIGGLALLFLYITNKWWVGQVKERETKHDEDKTQIRTDLLTVIDAKDRVIMDISGQLRDAMQQSRDDMERQYQRQAETIQRSEETIAANTTATNANTAAITALGELVRAQGGPR